MTADAALMTITRRAGRARLERERELAELARLMREPGGLAEAPEPVPLHPQGCTKFSTESITKFSTESITKFSKESTTTLSTTERATAR
jgi:hypothetical protein